MKVQVRLVTIIAMALVYVCVQPAWAAPTAPDAEESRALTGTGDPEEERSYIIAYQRIRSAHKIPISFEAVIPPYDPALRKIQFQIRENQTLAYSLEEFVEKTQNEFQWKRIRDVLCIFPSNPQGLPNTFDRPVSLDLEEVSAWEAFKALGKAMNANKASEHPGIRVMPGAEGGVRRTPAVFVEDRSISLHLENVSAREAACAIIAATPFQMSFYYGHSATNIDSLSIWMWREGRTWTEKGRVSPDEREFWLQEIEDASRP